MMSRVVVIILGVVILSSVILDTRAFTSSIRPTFTQHQRHQLELQREEFGFGAIGCTFNDFVCDPNIEFCFNDHAFGKCLPSIYNPMDSKDTLIYNLNGLDVEVLEGVLEDLFEKGYRWTHSYTQCRLQSLLQAIRNRQHPPSDSTFGCIEDIKENDLLTSDLTLMKLKEDGTKFIPRPLVLNLDETVQNQLPEDVQINDKELEEAIDDVLSKELNEDSIRKEKVLDYSFQNQQSSPRLHPFGSHLLQKPSNSMHTKDDVDVIFLKDDPSVDESELDDLVKVFDDNDDNKKEPPLRSDSFELSQNEILSPQDDLEDVFLEIPNPSSYSSALLFLNGNNHNNLKRFFNHEPFNSEEIPSSSSASSDNEVFELGFPIDLRPSEFQRRERLDVKKPGPWYRTVNNFAFDKPSFVTPEQFNQVSQERPRNVEFTQFGNPLKSKLKGVERFLIPSEDERSKVKSEEIPGKSEEINQLVDLMKKAASPAEASRLVQKFPGNELEVIDLSYVSIHMGNKMSSYSKAKELIHLLADFLDIPHSTFQKLRVRENNVITFKVAPNPKGLTAPQISEQIEAVKSDLEKELGVVILSAVAGVQANNEDKKVRVVKEVNEMSRNDIWKSTLSTPPTPTGESEVDDSLVTMIESDVHNKNLYIATFATCGIVAIILITAFVVFIMRRTSKSRDKLSKLSQNDTTLESCKDYQELCRARMASKTNEKMEPIRAVQRVQSNVSEGGTSSSRSSTSSWSEEPVVTNMDISTGHMVLSYMEDHLKKKDRLDQEWAALCTYEADPGSTSIGEKPENQKKNRYTNSLPYDHSRVVLNDLANISGSDYINASTITDHDPRNPAYIATQGPLPNTTADFWQMVWEQGSVVIVTLTKLNENGTNLCHRYWPEEGSELHHIYEVHLVSEHIWCDEYLVRSFYLKNLKTGETRTVTQFHFMAWTQNGIPTSAKSLLEFRRKVNKSYRGRSCPIIINCSDGAGRSGTYCLIDMVLNRMTKGAKEIDIAASLEHIRDQRPGMVRTKQQFEFVLMAVAEEVHAILKALPQ